MGVGPAAEAFPDNGARFDVWCDPEPTEQSVHPKPTWRADAATLEEAASFAVWGERSSSESPTRPTVASENTVVGQSPPFDPWNDADLHTNAAEPCTTTATMLNN
jgi:hypothetical protein